MLTLVSIAALLLYAMVVSQPFFFALALSEASSALSAAAYVELRQRINASIQKPLVQVYTAALLACLVLVVLGIVYGGVVLPVFAGIASLVLPLDLFIAVKRNVPINEAMNGWSLTEIPPDWAEQRARWNAAFTLRQALLTFGFVALTLGVVAGG